MSALQNPPDDMVMAPHIQLIPAGTTLWRVHSSHRDAVSFNERKVHALFKGNRFDGTDLHPYPYLYLGQEPGTALAETYLRGREFTVPAGVRLIGYEEVADKCLTEVRTETDLALVRLATEEDLAAVCQTSWLVDAEPRDYPQTRYWAGEIRKQATDAQGLAWVAHRHHPRVCVVLFGDRCGDGPLSQEGTVRLGTPDGFAEANKLLAPLRAVITPPKDGVWR
jgi:hypothetical protein